MSPGAADLDGDGVAELVVTNGGRALGALSHFKYSDISQSWSDQTWGSLMSCGIAQVSIPLSDMAPPGNPWPIASSDRFLVARLGGDSLDFVIQVSASMGIGWLLWSDSTGFAVGGGIPSGWYCGPRAMFCVADLDGDNIDSIVVYDPASLTLGVISANLPALQVAAQVQGQIPGVVGPSWNFQAGDQLYRGDVLGGGFDQIILCNPSSQLISVFTYEDDVGFSLAAPGGGAPGWRFQSQDQIFVGRVGAAQQDWCVFFDPQGLNLGLFSWGQQVLGAQWLSQGGSVPASGGQGTAWSLGPNDQLLLADVDGDGLDEIVIMNPGGALGVLKWNGSALATLWSAQGSISGWTFDAADQMTAGDLDGNGHPEIVLVRPGMALGVLTWGGSSLTLACQQTNNIPGWGLQLLVAAPSTPFQQFQGGELSAYAFISNKLDYACNGDIRSEYINLNKRGDFSSLSTMLNGLSYPPGNGFTQTDWNTVQGILLGELGSIDDVMNLFHNIRSLQSDHVRLQQKTDLLTVVDTINKSLEGTSVFSWSGQVADALLWGLAALPLESPLQVALALGASLFGSALSADPGGPQPIDYDDVEQVLIENTYKSVLALSDTNERTILQDAVMLPIAFFLANQQLSWPPFDDGSAKILSLANQLMFYQILLPTRFNVLVWPESSHDYPTYELIDRGGTFTRRLEAPSSAWWSEPTSDGAWNVYLLCVGNSYQGLEYPSDDMMNALFSDLGVQPSDLFKGANGWDGLPRSEANLVEGTA